MNLSLLAPAAAIAVTVAAVSITALAGKTHEHGALQLSLAIDGERLAIEMEAPLDGLIGFERTPRNDAERRAAADLLARLRRGGDLFVPAAAAQCRFVSANVRAPVLEPGAAPARGEHAELEASFEYRCAQPAQLRTLDVALFDAFKRLRKVSVQWAGAPGPTGAAGQGRVELKRPARSVTLAR
jgi:hypothetical protein